MYAPHVPRLGRSNTHLSPVIFILATASGVSSHQQGLEPGRAPCRGFGADCRPRPSPCPLRQHCAPRRAWTQADRVPVGSHRSRQPWRARTARYAPCNVVHQAHAQRLSPRMTMESCTHVRLRIPALVNPSVNGRTYHCAPNSSSLTCVRSRLIPLQANVPAPSARTSDRVEELQHRACGMFTGGAPGSGPRPPTLTPAVRRV